MSFKIPLDHSTEHFICILLFWYMCTCIFFMILIYGIVLFYLKIKHSKWKVHVYTCTCSIHSHMYSCHRLTVCYIYTINTCVVHTVVYRYAYCTCVLKVHVMMYKCSRFLICKIVDSSKHLEIWHRWRMYYFDDTYEFSKL